MRFCSLSIFALVSTVNCSPAFRTADTNEVPRATLQTGTLDKTVTATSVNDQLGRTQVDSIDNSLVNSEWKRQVKMDDRIPNKTPEITSIIAAPNCDTLMSGMKCPIKIEDTPGEDPLASVKRQSVQNSSANLIAGLTKDLADAFTLGVVEKALNDFTGLLSGDAFKDLSKPLDESLSSLANVSDELRLGLRSSADALGEVIETLKTDVGSEILKRAETLVPYTGSIQLSKRQNIANVLTGVKDLTNVVSKVLGTVTTLGKIITDTANNDLQLLNSLLSKDPVGLLTALPNTIQTFASGSNAILSGSLDAFLSLTSNLANAAPSLISNIASADVPLVSNLAGAAVPLVSGLSSAAVPLASGLASAAVPLASGLANAAVPLVSGLASAAVPLASGLASASVPSVSNVVNSNLPLTSNLVSSFQQAVSSGADLVSSIQSAANPVNMISSLLPTTKPASSVSIVATTVSTTIKPTTTAFNLLSMMGKR